MPGLASHWQLPTGPNAARVHAWIQQLLDADFQTRIDVNGAAQLLKRCEAATSRTASRPELARLNLRQLLHTIADLVADAPAEALPRLELELFSD